MCRKHLERESLNAFGDQMKVYIGAKGMVWRADPDGLDFNLAAKSVGNGADLGNLRRPGPTENGSNTYRSDAMKVRSGIMVFAMSAKRILILDGYPGERSLSRLFSETYAAAARAAGHEVKPVHLSDLDFGGGGCQNINIKPMEPAGKAFLPDLEWSEHVVMSAPMWWGACLPS